jgi:hypothetical protein
MLTNGGSSDSEANELTVAPYGVPSTKAVTTVTGAQTPAIELRKACSSIIATLPRKNSI